MDLAIFGLICLGLAVIGAFIRSAANQITKPATLPPPAAGPTYRDLIPPGLDVVLPPVNDGPGKFKVSGVDRATRLDTTMYVDADSPANARVKAELEGVVVTRIDRQATAKHENGRADL